jgi:hypothetical protein
LLLFACLVSEPLPLPFSMAGDEPTWIVQSLDLPILALSNGKISHFNESSVL